MILLLVPFFVSVVFHHLFSHFVIFYTLAFVVELLIEFRY